MNYGLINYQKQNGKSGIFWQQERKKTDQKKFGYRNKEQKFFLRTHPKNADRIDPDADREQILTLPEKKKPEKDFIAKNRTQVANKNKKPVKKDEGDKTDKNSGLITLTQDQLNAILASVGQVVSGKEDNLRISVDSSKNEIKIESPRKNKDDDRNSDYSDDDKYSRDRHEKEVKKSRKKKNDKEDSIFSLLGDSTDRDDSRDKRKAAAEAKAKKIEDERLEKEREERREYEKKRRERDARREKEEKRAKEKRERERDDSPEDRRREDSRDERRGRRRDDSRERRYRNDSRDRRRRDDSYERTRSPADSDYNDSSPKREPKKEITHLPPAGPSAFPKPLSLAEKKRLQWEKERIESKKGFDPWGKPGAGAPIRTRSGNIAADYRSRQVPSRTIVRSHNMCFMD